MSSLLFRLLKRKPLKRFIVIGMKLMLLTGTPMSVYAEQPMRVISTDAGITELMFALGLDKQLVAVDVTSQLPPDYPKLANIGYHRTLSAEGLLSLNPTIVIGSEHTGPENVLMALKQAKVQFVSLNSAKTSQQ